MQTILPSVVNMTLYFLIFGNFIGSRIESMGGFSYIQYIAPGIIMMSIINNAYANVVSSFFGAKFQRHIEEMLVAPIPNIIILSGYVSGGFARGIIVGLVVTIVAMFFTHLQVAHPLVAIAVVFSTSMLFSMAGFINGIFAKKFDDITIVPTFVLTPLIYLGGVFYPIDLLPEIWQIISKLNPLFYMIDAFRYGMLGTSISNIETAFIIITSFNIVLFCMCLWLMEKGVGIKD